MKQLKPHRSHNKDYDSHQDPPNKALQLTANPLRGLPAAELSRYLP